MKRKVAILCNRPWFDEYESRLRNEHQLDLKVIRDAKELTDEWFREFSPEFVFAPFWSHKIPKSVYEGSECVIFHMTDLPFGRGGSPLQNLLARGIYETKVSAVRCVEELDAGPVYLKKDLDLHEGSAEEIFRRAAGVISGMISEILKGGVKPVPQSGTPTVFKRRKPEEGDMSSLAGLTQVFDYIRMLDAPGYPPAFLIHGKTRYEFSDAKKNADGSVSAKVRIKEIE